MIQDSKKNTTVGGIIKMLFVACVEGSFRLDEVYCGNRHSRPRKLESVNRDKIRVFCYCCIM